MTTKSPLPRLFVLGDSISMHYGPHLEAHLRGQWGYDRKRGRPADIDQGKGANGGDSANVLSWLRERRAAGGLAADLLLLNCGLHDIKTDLATGARQVPLPEYEANLAGILAEAAGLGVRVLWVRTTPVVEELHNAVPRRKEFNRFLADVNAYNAAADAVMRAKGIPMLDLFAFTLPFLPGGSDDGVHFNEEVRRLQAAFLAGALHHLRSRFGVH